jgi:hypothetical protein
VARAARQSFKNASESEKDAVRMRMNEAVAAAQKARSDATSREQELKQP